jgi:hypothetical protein
VKELFLKTLMANPWHSLLMQLYGVDPITHIAGCWLIYRVLSFRPSQVLREEFFISACYTTVKSQRGFQASNPSLNPCFMSFHILAGCSVTLTGCVGGVELAEIVRAHC